MAPIDAGPELLRRPFGFHLAADALPSPIPIEASEAFPPPLDMVPSTRAPVGRLFVVGRDPGLDGAIGKLLELLHVDPQGSGRTKLHLLPGRHNELRIRAGGQFRLEGMPRQMNDLVQIRRTRFGIKVGPDGVDELLAMELVSGIQRQ